MAEKLIEKIHTWYFSAFTKTFCMSRLNIILDLDQRFQDKFSTKKQFINFIT